MIRPNNTIATLGKDSSRPTMSNQLGSETDEAGGEPNQAAKSKKIPTLLNEKLSLMSSSKSSSNADELVESSKLKQAVVYDGPGPDVLKQPKGDKEQIRGATEGKDANKRPRKKSAKQRIPRARKPKDMPRRPLSAYNIFFKSERAKMLEAPPANSADEGTPSGKIGFEQLAKTIGRNWKELHAGELSKYKAEAEDDMRRYKQEMEDYHQNLAKKRRVILPPDPSQDQDESSASTSAVVASRSAGVSTEGIPYMVSLASDSLLSRGPGIDATRESLFSARGALDHSNYYIADALMSSARAQHGLQRSSADQQQQASFLGLQELANLRRQELYLQQATSDPLSAGISGSNTSSSPNSLLYERMLANELFRSQHGFSGGGLGLQSIGSYAQQFLGGLTAQSQAQATLEQMLFLQQDQNQQQLTANLMQPGIGDQTAFSASPGIAGIHQSILAAQQAATSFGTGGYHQADLDTQAERDRQIQRDQQTQEHRQTHQSDDLPPGGSLGM